MTSSFDHCTIAGVDVATASRAQLADSMARDCQKRREHVAPPLLVFDINGHGLSLRETDAAYRRALERADMLHADGGFLVTLSRWFTDDPIAERSATTDLIHDFAARAAKDGLSFYLLGGTEQVNAECARRLTLLYPGLEIVGRRNGFFAPDEEDGVIAEINALRPDILWVGLGKPKEQIVSVAWHDRLRAGWLVTCGGCFNYITGDYSRAPRWMQQSNLEWLYRMFSDPRKLFWRYLVTTPHALWLALSRTRRGTTE